MNVELKVVELDNQKFIPAQAAASVEVPVAVAPKSEEKSEVSTSDAALDLTGLTAGLLTDSTHIGSNFEVCPDASIPTDSNAHVAKLDALAKHAKKYPTESQPIQTMILYAQNLADAALLTKEAKQTLIEHIQEATKNSTERAASKGYQGNRGAAGSTQFLQDTLAPFKPVTASISHAEVIHQTLRAINGGLILAGSDKNHPSAAVIHAQNRGVMQSIGSSAPNALGSKSKAPAASQQPGNVAGANDFPAPVLPSTGATPPPFNFPPAGSTIGLKGLKDYYAQLLQYIHAHPGDIAAQQYLMVFLVKLSNFYGGNIPADVTNILDPVPHKGAGALDAIKSFIPRLIQYSFFTGYGTDTNNGKAGLTQYLAAMKNALAGSAQSPYVQAIEQEIQKRNQPGWINAYTNAHTDPATKGLIYNVVMPGTPPYTMTYHWDNSDADKSSEMTSQFFITQVLNNQGPSQDPSQPQAADPFNIALDGQINDMETNYRVSALQDLLAQYKDPLTAITLWIMQVYDNQYQTQEGGLNETTDDLTMMTNEIATRLSTLGQNIGFTGFDPKTGMPTGQKMTGDQAEAFLKTLANGSTLMNSMYQLNGIESSWDNNVFKDLCSITLTNPNNPVTGKPCFTDFGKAGHFPATVGELLYGKNADGTDLYTNDQKATFLSTLNMGPPNAPTGGGLPPQPAPPSNLGFQQLTGDFQQAGSLITGRSKMASMQLQQVSDCDSQDIKAWSTILQDLAQFILKGPIAGQKQS